MATYKEFEKFVRAKFPVREKDPDTPKGFIAVLVPCGDERSHQVFITPRTTKNGENADVVAFIGEISGKKLIEVLDKSFNLPIGGIVRFGDGIALRHTILLANVDESEIFEGILLLAFSADILESNFVGGDDY